MYAIKYFRDAEVVRWYEQHGITNRPVGYVIGMSRFETQMARAEGSRPHQRPGADSPGRGRAGSMSARHRGSFELRPIETRSGLWVLHIPQPCSVRSKTLIVGPNGPALLPYLATHHGDY